MSETSHTPGPWEVSTWQKDGTAAGVYQEDAETGEDLDFICHMEEDIEPLEMMANARLIASAPALLAACKAAVEATGGSAIWNGETKKFLEMCEAAIQQAEGGAG